MRSAKTHAPDAFRRRWSSRACSNTNGVRGQNGKMKHFLGLSLFDPDGYFYEVNQLLRESD